MNSVNFPDFTPLILKKKSENTKKSTHINYEELNNIKKLEDNEGNFKLNLISKDVSTKVITARSSRKLTRKQLATLCNIKEQDVADIENGKALRNNINIRKILKYLKV